SPLGRGRSIARQLSQTLPCGAQGGPAIATTGPAMKLNLGCGQNKVEGYLNVDKYAACAPDRVVDLEAFPWPFPDASVDEILLTHVLEHLGRETETFFGIMRELHRVLKPGGKVQIRVPHPRSEGDRKSTRLNSSH